VKNVLLVNTLLTILLLSDTCGGCIHEKRMVDATPYPLPMGNRLLQDLGFLAFTLPQAEILMPRKKLHGQDLTQEQTRVNQALHYRRLRIEMDVGRPRCRYGTVAVPCIISGCVSRPGNQWFNRDNLT
jgi:hypothetical protein